MRARRRSSGAPAGAPAGLSGRPGCGGRAWCRSTRSRTATAGWAASCSPWFWRAEACSRRSWLRSRYTWPPTPGEYYAALQAAHGPIYEATGDATPWLDFCIEAHLAEARRLHERIELIERRNTFCERLAEAGGYPDRLVSVLDQALMGLAISNAEHRSEHGIAAITASNDLRRLVGDGWLVLDGAGRSARYLASERLQDAWLEEEGPRAAAGPSRRPP